MKNYILKPSIDLFPGVRVDKDTKLEYKTENVQQIIENLILHSVTHEKGDGYARTCHTTVYLKEGDILIFEDEGRGYIKPLQSLVTIEEAIEDLENIKDLGGE